MFRVYSTLSEKLQPQEFDIPTYYFGVPKNVGISSTMIIFRVERNWRHGIGPLHYSTPWWYLSSGLSSNPKKYCVKTIHPREVEVPKYHFKVHKIVGISSWRVMFMGKHSWRHGVGNFHYCTPFSNCLSSDPIKDHMQNLCPLKLTYQLTTLWFIKMLVFHLIVSCLGYIVAKYICNNFWLLYSSVRPFQLSLEWPKRRLYANITPLRSWYSNLPLFFSKIY